MLVAQKAVEKVALKVVRMVDKMADLKVVRMAAWMAALTVELTDSSKVGL